MATDSLQFLETVNQSLQTHHEQKQFDVAALDRVVQIMNASTGAAQSRAAFILASFKELDSAWTRVDAILSFSASIETKYFALQILEGLIDTRWKQLPREQAEGIKGFLVSAILDITNGGEEAYEKYKLYLQKLDIVLIHVVKQEWPRYWPTFISDIVGSSFSNEYICINNMIVLRLLSEEVFEFGTGLTSQRAFHLKEQFCHEFEHIYNLSKQVLENTTNADLVIATLRALCGFLSWIPIGFVFKDNLIELISKKYLPYIRFRSIALQCLVEVASISFQSLQKTMQNTYNQYSPKMLQMFNNVLDVIQADVTDEMDLSRAYSLGSTDDQQFLSNLAQFFTTYFKEHLVLVEGPARKKNVELQDRLNYALTMMVRLTDIEDVEVFKICLDFWNWLCNELYQDISFRNARVVTYNSAGNDKKSSRIEFYQSHLSRLRSLMICRMVKPEEVIVVVNENNEAVRELVKDTDSMILYRTMRETLVMLTHLDPRDTENQMTQKLQQQVNGAEWSWRNLNTLCWAIGSISGALTEESEKRFLVAVIRDLLGLCELKRGKDNKAVIATNIMYVVGQYPRFLRAHWKFLKTVINKLFEFMHECHEGVQDMACETFIKIVMKCANHFVIVQAGERRPFIDDILNSLNSIICDLSRTQVHVFFEALGYIIHAERDEKVQANLVEQLMVLPNSVWDEIISKASADPNVITTPDIIRDICHIMKTNSATCKPVGIGFFHQLKRIVPDMLALYQFVSGSIGQAVTENGDAVLKQPLLKSMRSVKKDILVLLSTFIGRTIDISNSKIPSVSEDAVIATILKPLFLTVITDFRNNVTEAREPKVLSLLAITITALKSGVSHMVPSMIEGVYEPTLEMISNDLESYPEHRENFFTFIAAIVRHSFDCLLKMDSRYVNWTVDVINWGLKHTMRSVAESSAHILREIFRQLLSFADGRAKEFISSYFLKICQNVIDVASDYNQVPFVGLTNMSETLCPMFQLLENGIKFPLYPGGGFPNNKAFVISNLGASIKTAFNHLTDSQLQIILEGFFSFDNDADKMRTHIRDFIIQIRQKNGDDVSDLYLEEKAKEIECAKSLKECIPGILNPYADMKMA